MDGRIIVKKDMFETLVFSFEKALGVIDMTVEKDQGFFFIKFTKIEWSPILFMKLNEFYIYSRWLKLKSNPWIVHLDMLGIATKWYDPSKPHIQW